MRDVVRPFGDRSASPSSHVHEFAHESSYGGVTPSRRSRYGECPPDRVCSAAVPRPRASLAGALLPLALFLAAEAGVRAHRDRTQLSLQLEPAPVPLVRERARAQRLLHGTAGLGLVRAVREPARERQLLDVRERRVDGRGAALPQLKLA